MQEIAEIIFKYGGTVVLAVLFVYIFLQDRKQTEEEKKERNEQTKQNTELLGELAKSNDNIAKSLEIISKNTGTMSDKIDRNYCELLRIRESKEE